MLVHTNDKIQRMGKGSYDINDVIGYIMKYDDAVFRP